MSINRGDYLGRIDFMRPEFGANLLENYQWLRVECPLSWNPSSKSWLTTRYQDASMILRDKQLPHSGIVSIWRQLRDRYGWNFPTALNVVSKMPFNHEGKEHAMLRRVFASGLAPFADLHGVFGAVVGGLLRSARRNGGFDLAEDFAGRLLFTIFCDLAEIPEQDRPTLDILSRYSWAIEATLPLRERVAFEAALQEPMVLLREEVARQLARSSNSLLTALYRNLPERMEDRERSVATIFCVMLLMGNDALGGALMFGVQEMLQPAGERSGPVAQAEWGGISDEVLRYAASVDFLTRVITHDMIIGGLEISAGDVVAVSPFAANHDPLEFGEDADTISPRRRRGVGLTFGGGAHVCVGMRMSRHVMQSALEGLAKMPMLRLAGQPQRSRGQIVRTFDHFPVSLE